MHAPVTIAQMATLTLPCHLQTAGIRHINFGKLSARLTCQEHSIYAKQTGIQTPRDCSCCSQPKASTSWRQETLPEQKASAPQPGRIRCALCFAPDSSDLTQLAGHLVGKRHADHYPDSEVPAPCPYCGLPVTKRELYDHIRTADCPAAGRVSIPPSQRRTITQAELDRDPRYTPIVEERISSGLLRIRPMHMQHTFETALVVTEAFIIDMNPPHFGMLLSDLRRQALEYQANPAPVIRHAVDFFNLPDIAAPPVDDVVCETRGGVGSVFPVASEERRELREQQRRDIEKAWGVWIWLVADLVPDDPQLLSEGQDSRIIGATAMMFHDRAAALEHMQLMDWRPHVADLDYNLWLSSRPPPDQEHKRAVFIWWTSVDLDFRRKGVAGLLLRGCEAVGGAAGFWSFYIQASLRRRDPLKILSAWLPREYNAALKAYTKAGFTEYVQPGSLWYQTNSDASLMYKHF